MVWLMHSTRRLDGKDENVESEDNNKDDIVDEYGGKYNIAGKEVDYECEQEEDS